MVTPRTWWKKFKFVVEIDGVARAAFNKCSAIEPEVADVAYSEGGDIRPYHSPGNMTQPEVTMERGATDDFDLYNLWKNTIDVATGEGLNEPDLYFECEIVQLDRNGDEVERYHLYDCYVRKFSSGDWDNAADEVRLEVVTIQPRYAERIPTAA